MLKLQYFGHLMRRTDSLEKTLMLGKIEGRRRGDDRGWDGWMASPNRWTWVWVNSGGLWWTGKPGMMQPWGSQRAGRNWTTKRNWTELNNLYHVSISKWILYQLGHQGSPRILKCIAYPFSSGSSWPRNWTGVSCIAGRHFTIWATREA